MPDNDNCGSETKDWLSRRQWLQTAGTASVAFFAGCQTDQGGEPTDTSPAGNGGEPTASDQTSQPGEPTDTSGEGQPPEPILDGRWRTSTAPGDLNWNPFTGGAYPNTPSGFAFEHGGYLNAETGELHTLAIDSWEYDGESSVMTLNLQDNLKYWNGDSYTAQDWAASHRVTRLLAPESSQWEQIETPDETTARYHYREARNPDILSLQIVTEWATIGTDVWGEWIQRLEDAGSQDQRDQVNENLTEFTISNQEFIDRGLGTGPYTLEEMNEEGLTFQKWDDHRNADQIEIETFKLPFAGGRSREDQLATNDVYDFSPGVFPSRYEGAAPEHLETLASWQAKQMLKMLINWRNRESLKDVNVRRAMAAIINTKEIQEVVGADAPVSIHSGMDQGFTENYVGNRADDYIDYYPGETRADLADSFLEQSGYSRQNGTVVGPDGNEIEPLRFLISTNDAWGLPLRVASDQLKAYGFPINDRRVSRDTKIQTIYESMGEWDVSSESHYAAGTNHPYSYFDYGTMWGWRLGPASYGPDANLNQQIEQWLSEGEEYSPYNGKPMTPEIPTQVGQQTLDGETKEINIYELINEVQTPVAEQRTKEIIQDLSWAWNFHMPDIDLKTVVNGVWGDTKNFTWPENRTQLKPIQGGAFYLAVQHGWVGYP